METFGDLSGIFIWEKVAFSRIIIEKYLELLANIRESKKELFDNIKVFLKKNKQKLTKKPKIKNIQSGWR